MTDEDKCLRCGQCCYREIYGEVKPCIYMQDDKLCRIYATRLGTLTDTEFYYGYIVEHHCVSRVDCSLDFVGCPYNTDKPIKDYRNKGKGVENG